MVPDGSIWAQMAPYGTIWLHMVPDGSIWSHTPENTNPQFSQSVSQSVVHKQQVRFCRREWGFWQSRLCRQEWKIPDKYNASYSTATTCLIMSVGMAVLNTYNASDSTATCHKIQTLSSVSQSVSQLFTSNMLDYVGRNK